MDRDPLVRLGMMPLSTMWRVDSVTGPNGDSPVAESILEHWDHDPLSARFFRSSANFLHFFYYAGQPYCLRFADGAERTRDGIEAEMDLLCWLDREGVTVTPPVPSRHGNLVETVGTNWGVFHAVVFPALRGEQREIDDMNTSHFRSWGSALGALHSTLRRYTGKSRWGRGTWKDQLDVVRPYLEAHRLIVREEHERIRALLQSLPTDREVFGLIHADFELDNLLWTDRTVGILDFDDCVHSWYVADIALALRDLFQESVDLEHPSFQAFVHGYTEHHSIDKDMLLHIPIFLRLSRFLTYARLTRALDLPANRTYPEWLATLQRKLETWMRAYESQLESRRHN